ncbi:hypothetical protein ACVIGB_000603 [Bradyrhizobium sp. USDA 4341]
MAKAKQTREVELERALKTLVDACGHVNLGAFNGATVRDFRKVMKFMAACDAAKELLGEE